MVAGMNDVCWFSLVDAVLVTLAAVDVCVMQNLRRSKM